MKSEDILQIIDLAIKIHQSNSINISLHDLPYEVIDVVIKHCENKYLLKDDNEKAILKIGSEAEDMEYCAPVTIFK